MVFVGHNAHNTCTHTHCHIQQRAHKSPEILKRPSPALVPQRPSWCASNLFGEPHIGVIPCEGWVDPVLEALYEYPGGSDSRSNKLYEHVETVTS